MVWLAVVLGHLLLGEGRVAPEVVGDGVQHDQLRLMELETPELFRVGGRAQLRHSFADMGLPAAQALLQAVFKIGRDMAHAALQHDAGVEHIDSA